MLTAMFIENNDMPWHYFKVTNILKKTEKRGK